MRSRDWSSDVCSSDLGFQPLNLWPLTLAVIALFMMMAHAAQSRWGALALGWWFGLGHFTLGLNWIATSFTYQVAMPVWLGWVAVLLLSLFLAIYPAVATGLRSEEHTSELQSLMRISYAVFCLKKKKHEHTLHT